MKEVLEAYEQQSTGMSQRLNDLSPKRWKDTLDFFGTQRPAAPMAWSFLFDIIHHRGQITTYLRPMARRCRRSTVQVRTNRDRTG